ncbi:MAG: winged helix-turn-helix transcriptional regulator [Sphingobacteriales bacterium]
MKKMSVVVDCPIDTTINVVKGKCKAGIILKIHEGLNRFGLLKKEISIGTKLLAIQLNELEEDGIVIKSKNNPLDTSYSLSIDGKNLCTIILQMQEWGNGYKLFRHLNN